MTDTQKLISLTRSTRPLTATQLGWVVGELIKHERAPGGPYNIFDSRIENSQFNKSIAKFIRRQSPPLTKQILTRLHQKQLQGRYRQARFYINTLPKSLHPPIYQALEKIRSADTVGEIGLLSSLFAENFIENKSAKSLAEQFDIANILVWISYTLYDKVADTPSSKNTQYIPAATATLRIAQSIFHQAGGGTIATSLLNEVDGAIAEEVFRNISSSPTPLSTLEAAMSKKSIAHVAGPLALVTHFIPRHVVTFHAALKKYCAARQLLDDIYDWQEDLTNKHFTYANVQMNVGATPEEKRAIKRRLIQEALEVSENATHILMKLSTAADNILINITTKKVATTAKRALAYDSATIEAAIGYTTTCASQ